MYYASCKGLVSGGYHVRVEEIAIALRQRNVWFGPALIVHREILGATHSTLEIIELNGEHGAAFAGRRLWKIASLSCSGGNLAFQEFTLNHVFGFEHVPNIIHGTSEHFLGFRENDVLQTILDKLVVWSLVKGHAPN